MGLPVERIHELNFNEETEAELHRHRLTIDDAYQVFEERPFFRPQPPTDERSPDGSLRRRPPRVQMIGPDRTGRLLTFILERPLDGAAHVVTGWEANKEQQDRYRKAKGKRRT